MIDILILFILIIQLPVFIYAYYTAGSFVIEKIQRSRRANTIRKSRRERHDR